MNTKTYKIRVAILYICTGKYTVFWKDFFQSTEKNFLVDCQVEYFVFTDGSPTPINNKVTVIECNHLGWPFDTLLRFMMFCEIRDELRRFDYVFFMNANLLVVKPITAEILPIKEELLGVIHPGFYNRRRSEFTYEENLQSSAYIPPNQGEFYFMGGFNGGRRDAFLEMSQRLKINIENDLENGVIAVWHDESHLNKYFWDNRDILKILNPSYGYPEEWILPFEKKILIREKAKFGGHSYLRGIDYPR